MAFKSKALDKDKLDKGAEVKVNGMTFYVGKMTKAIQADLYEAYRERKDSESINNDLKKVITSLIKGWEGVTPKRLQDYCVCDEFFYASKKFEDDDSDDTYTMKRASDKDVTEWAKSDYLPVYEQVKKDFKDTATKDEMKQIALDRSFNKRADLVIDEWLLDWDAELEEGEGKVKLSKAIRQKIKTPELMPQIEALADLSLDFEAFKKPESDLEDREIAFSPENVENYIVNMHGIDVAHDLSVIIQAEANKDENYRIEKLKKDVEDAKK